MRKDIAAEYVRMHMAFDTEASEVGNADSVEDESDNLDDAGEAESTDEHTGTHMEFSDTVALETSKDELWAFISDPENLAECIPGAQSVEQLSKRKYSVEIKRGVSRLTISVSGDVELVEMNEPDWIVADGNAFDSTTGSEFDVLAAMEMTEVDDETVELAYTAELWFTGGVTTLTGGIVRSLVKTDVKRYFENIREEIEASEN